MCQWDAGGEGGRQAGAQVGWTARGGTLGEVCGEQAEWLALVGGQGGAVAFEIAWDAAAGGTRAVAEGLDAALPLQLCSRAYYIPRGGLRHGISQSLSQSFVACVC